MIDGLATPCAKNLYLRSAGSAGVASCYKVEVGMTKVDREA